MKHVLLSIILFTATLLRGEDLYFTQSGAGNTNGLSVENAWSLVQANNETNWASGEGKISAGDTLHLSGTITGAFTFQASGTTGIPITLLFDEDSGIITDYLTAGITASSKTNITIDGGVNGLIHYTNNGTARDYQVNAVGVVVSGDTLVVKNLTITNMYRCEYLPDANRFGYGIQVSGCNITVVSNTVSDGDGLITGTIVTGYSTNWLISRNTLLNANHAISIGGNQTNAWITGVTISHNTIDHLDVWQTDVGHHLDGMILYNEAADYSGGWSNTMIYGNRIGPYVGTTNTAGIFLISYRPVQNQRMWIYNNLFLTTNDHTWANGCIAASPSNTSYIVNNSFIHLGTTRGGIAIAATREPNIMNNLFSNTASFVSLGAGSTVQSNFLSDFNVFGGSIPGSGTFIVDNYRQQSWYGWTNGMAANIGLYPDHNSVTNHADLDADYAPLTTDTTAYGKGTNLSFLFTTDINGRSRPATGAWTIGAFETETNVTPPTVTITAPTNSSKNAAGLVVFTATPSGGTGNATNLIWYTNDVAMATNTTAPWSITNTLVSGEYTNWCYVETDDSTNSYSATNTFSVRIPVQAIAITFPLAGSIHPPGAVAMTVSVTAGDEAITSVGYYIAGILVGTATEAPWGLSYDPGPGVKSLVARAHDAGGFAIDSAAVSFTAQNPTVSTNAPAFHGWMWVN